MMAACAMPSYDLRYVMPPLSDALMLVAIQVARVRAAQEMFYATRVPRRAISDARRCPRAFYAAFYASAAQDYVYALCLRC